MDGINLLTSNSSTILKSNSCNDLISFGEESNATKPEDVNFEIENKSLSAFQTKPRTQSTNIRPRRPPPPVPLSNFNSNGQATAKATATAAPPIPITLAASSFYVDNPVPHKNASLPNLVIANGHKGKTTVAQLLSGHREQNMKLFMEKRRDDYTVKKPYNIFAGTWNVNGQYPPHDLRDWLAVDLEPPDLYYIGFQELDLSKEAMLFSESVREEEWQKVVGKSLHPGGKYYLVGLNRLVGMMLLVYARVEHRKDISDHSQHQVGTGIMGRMGNKGGVGVRLALHRSKICVINSHLAAHMEEVERRNQDYRDVGARLKFPINGQSPSLLGQHDIIVWLGDLNYRICELHPDKVKAVIDIEDYDVLKQYDQLLLEKSFGNVFEGYCEGEIRFRPTYKYDPGTDTWDTSDKCRAPAWCDRILWWEVALTQQLTTGSNEKPRRTVEQQRYDSHMKLKISDHKPVSALFKVMINVLDPVKYKRVFEEENRKLDRLENEYLPTMKLDLHEIDFGEVKFQEARQGKVVITNTGQIPCNYEFISKPNDDNICPTWLTISSMKGCLFPNESCTLNFEVYINRITAPDLNCGRTKLEDILILHLIGGKDFFITVTGKYLPSCFGCSIEALCRMKQPIREVSTKDLLRLSNLEATRMNDADDAVSDSSDLLVPKELWRIIDHLFTNARKQEDLFQQPGLHTEVSAIRDCLDNTMDATTDRHPLPGSNHSVAEALLLMLEALPQPVIPFHLYKPCLQVHEDFLNCKQVLRGLSIRHQNTFKYLMSFLRELLKYKDHNGLDVNLLASVFSGLMLRAPPSSIRQKDRMDARFDRQSGTKFIIQFLRHEYDE